MSAPVPYIGNYGFLGLKKETTFGTPVDVDTYWPLDSEGFETDSGYQAVPTIRGTRAENNLSFGGEIKSVGNMVVPFGSKNGVLLLAGALGQDTVTGASPNYVHTMVPKESGIPSFTVEKNLGDPAGTGPKSQQFAGCLINKLDIELVTNAVGKMTADFVNQIDISGFTPSTPSYVADQPFSLANYGAKIGGTSNPAIKSFKVSIDNQVKADYTFNGHRYAWLIYSSGRVITGEIVLILQSMSTDYADAMAGTYKTLEIDMVQDVNTACTLNFTNVQWGKPSQPLKRGELITQTLPFTAYFIPGAAYDIQCVVKNSVSGAYV